MAAPVIYRSSDASAPVLTGVAGSLVSVLDACLVNGYGSKAAAGWTKSYSGTNQASYRQAAGNSFYLDVDDRGASGVLTGASGQEAAVRGYEAMTALSTGTNPFPTAAQVAVATANWRKSATADSQPRGWVLIADDRTLYLFVRPVDNTGGQYYGYFFGDVYSLKSGDGYRTGVSVRTTVNASGTGGGLVGALSSSFNGTSAGFYLARIAAATGTSIQGGYLAVGSSLDINSPLTTSLDGNIYLDRILLSQGNTTPFFRGWMRGLYAGHNVVGVNDGDTFSGAGDLAGRTFLYIEKVNSTSVGQGLIVETTAWDTSS